MPPRSASVEAERRAARASEAAAAEANPPELRRLPSDDESAVRELEIARVIREPVAGAADEQRVVDDATAIRARQFAGSIVDVGHLEIGRQQPAVMNPLEHERTVGWRCRRRVLRVRGRSNQQRGT
jgi:hypothetical protein